MTAKANKVSNTQINYTKVKTVNIKGLCLSHRHSDYGLQL